MDLLVTLRAYGGAARLDELLAAGLVRRHLNALLSTGRVDLHPGRVVALPDASAALVIALRLRGVLCDLAAALWWGMAVLEPPRTTTVAIPRGTTRRSLPGATVVRRDLTVGDVSPDRPVTSPVKTVTDCARRLGLLAALVVADSAASQRLVTPDDLVRAARQLQGPGSARARRVARLADPRCESVLETVLRTLLMDMRVSFELQVSIPGVGRVDALVDGWLVIEADGFDHHRSRVDYREDRRRANALAAGGYVLVRLSYEDLVHHPERTRRLLAQVIARQGRLASAG